MVFNRTLVIPGAGPYPTRGGACRIRKLEKIGETFRCNLCKDIHIYIIYIRVCAGKQRLPEGGLPMQVEILMNLRWLPL